MGVSKRLDNWIFYLLVALVVLLPLFFLPIVPTFLLPKITLVRLLSISIGLLWALKVTVERRLSFRRTPLDLTILLLLAAASVATLLSLSPRTSFFGEQGRWEGLLSLINYAFLYFAATNFIDRRRLPVFMTGIAASGTAVAAFAIMERFTGNFVVNYVTSVPGGGLVRENLENLGRPYATMINPMYLGILLALTVVVSVGLLAYSLELRRKSMFLIGVALSIAGMGLVVSYTRSAWLAAGVAVVLLALFGWRNRPVLKAVAVVVVLASIAGGAISLQGALTGKGNPDLKEAASAEFKPAERLSSIARVQEGSASERLKMWRQAVELIRRRPIVGTGPDTFGIVTQVTNGPHNELLASAMAMGLPGLVAIFLLWSTFAVAAARYFRRGRDSLTAALAAALAGYIVYLVFAYSHPSYSPLAWIMLGAFFATAGPGKRLEMGLDKEWLRPAVACTAVVAATILTLYASISLYSDYLFYRGLFKQMRLGERAALADVDRAVELSPMSTWYIMQEIRLNLILGDKEGNRMPVLKAVELADGMEEIEPNYPQVFVYTADYLTDFGKGDRELLGAAYRRLNVAIDLVKRDGLPEGLGGLYARRALVSLYLGDKSAALSDADEAFLLKPRTADGWARLGRVYNELGKEDKARACREKAEALGINRWMPAGTLAP